MKKDMTDDELIEWCKSITENNDKKINISEVFSNRE